MLLLGFNIFTFWPDFYRKWR